jgi:chromosome segregation ATPase
MRGYQLYYLSQKSRLDSSSNDSEKIIKETKTSQDTEDETLGDYDLPVPEVRESIEEKLMNRDSKAFEFINALVNGDSISQLFIKHDLTQAAIAELTKLKDAMDDKKIANAEEELTNLKNEIENKKKEYSKLTDDINSMTGTITKLNDEIENLKKRKLFIANLVNSDLNAIADFMKENTIEENEYDKFEWKNEVTSWNDAWYKFQNRKPIEFDLVVASIAKDYSLMTGCTLAYAMGQLCCVSPRIKEISEYIKLHEKELEKYNTIIEWGNSCSGEEKRITGYIYRDMREPKFGTMKSGRKR